LLNAVNAALGEPRAESGSISEKDSLS